ncbi:hypothetical protein AB0K60_25385 [Thermopolyspora sp. NPDC052614]|uniref:hypothetical protein n=1 Tax=Thermopolyspora sp. NPDC052614 TaxID=3155682 RepID=UPI00341C32A0
MTKQPHERPVERGGEEAAGTPPTSTEEEASRRPAGATPGATPRSDAGESRLMDEHAFNRQKELNPDDFE